MHEFKVGDAVRIKGQRGRPRKWLIEELLLVGEAPEAELYQYLKPHVNTTVFIKDLAPYPVKAAKVEEVV